MKMPGRQKEPYSIQKSRIGFGYQDKYALFIFLKYLLDKNIKAFFVDKPFGSNDFSLDVLIIPRKVNNIEIIYEIKTGEEFQRKNEGIAHALKVFHRYSKTRSKKCEFHLIVIPQLRAKLGGAWWQLKHLQENKSLKYGSQKISPKKLAEKLIKDFRLEKEFNDYKEFMKFVQDIKEIKEGVPYEKTGMLSEFTIIEDQIIQSIVNLGKTFEIEYPLELKPENLMKNLLYDIQKGAENGGDIYSLAKESIIDFFVHKSMIAKKFSDEHFDPNVLKKQETNKIKEIFIEKFEGGIIEQLPRDAREQQEGKEFY